MRRASMPIRFLVVLLALVQALGMASASIADARLVASNPFISGAAHVEADGSGDCPATHPLDCALCQYLGGTFLPAAPDAGLLVSERAVALPYGPAQHRRAAEALRQPPSRAPPTFPTA